MFLSSLLKLCQIICHESSKSDQRLPISVFLPASRRPSSLCHVFINGLSSGSPLPFNSVQVEVLSEWHRYGGRGYDTCSLLHPSLTFSRFSVCVCVSWLYDVGGPVASLTRDVTNGPELHWASELSFRSSSRTPVRGLYLCITSWLKGRRWWWASGGMLGSLASGRLAHDQSALGATVGGGERAVSWRSEVNSWLSTADFGQHESAEAAGKNMLVTCLQETQKNHVALYHRTLRYCLFSTSHEKWVMTFASLTCFLRGFFFFFFLQTS